MDMSLKEFLRKIAEMMFTLIVVAFFIVFFAIVLMLMINGIAWWANYLGFI